MKINEHYRELPESYLFSTIAQTVNEYTKAHPEAKIIRMGIGDVTLPICQKAAEAFAAAAREQGEAESFHGGAENCIFRRQPGERLSSHAAVRAARGSDLSLLPQ